MCGIYASISHGKFTYADQQLKSFLNKRGPDHTGETHVRSYDAEDKPLFVHFTSTVLSLRGSTVTHQPLIDHLSGSVLCWNGEAWKFDDSLLEGNDSQVVFERLLETFDSAHSDHESIEALLDVLNRISGPFALIFYDKPRGYVIFCRDRLGRRSLLYNDAGLARSVQISSVSGVSGAGWTEVEADGVYVMSLQGEIATILPDQETNATWLSSFSIQRFPWKEGSPQSLLNRFIYIESHCLDHESTSVKTLDSQLRQSLFQRIRRVPVPPGTKDSDGVRIAVLFSGGIDCTVLARISHDLLPHDQPIDLINVAFENPRVMKAASLKKNCPVSKTVSATSIEDFSDPNESPYESCPDRITGRKAVRELRQACPERRWRFIEVNVPYSETLNHRAQIISLIFPHQTEMDLSIACALYFAARGSGLASTDGSSSAAPPQPYTTPARVLLSGLGADELFGGYVRHSTAFSRRGFDGLLDELELDVKRLGKRNLGRDDRVISHWGKEARFPFLDEALVGWALGCPVQDKCGFGTSRAGERRGRGADLDPEKLVLRILADSLGMPGVAREKKRAIQFGARTAKMETGRTKGTASIE